MSFQTLVELVPKLGHIEKTLRKKGGKIFGREVIFELMRNALDGCEKELPANKSRHFNQFKLSTSAKMNDPLRGKHSKC